MDTATQSAHASAGRTAINAAAVLQSGNAAAAAAATATNSSPRRHPGDGAEMLQTASTPMYRSAGFANAASVKTGLVNRNSTTADATSAPTIPNKSLGQLKDEMQEQTQLHRPKSWRHQMQLQQQQQQQQQQQKQRWEIGAVPTSGGGAFYFPNGIPSGYFSDATCNDVWADDEMEAEM